MFWQQSTVELNMINFWCKILVLEEIHVARFVGWLSFFTVACFLTFVFISICTTELKNRLPVKITNISVFLYPPPPPPDIVKNVVC